jgi:hypothetical protein
VEKFAASYQKVLDTIQAKRAEMTGRSPWSDAAVEAG